MTQPTAAEWEFLLQQAADWLTKSHSGDFSEANRLELTDWRTADSQHELAWQHIQNTWEALGNLRGHMLPGSQPLLQERYPAEIRRQQPDLSNPRRRQTVFAITCSMILVMALAYFNPPLLLQADYVTGKGEQRTVTLADNSRVMLNTNTALAVHFDDKQRRIKLLQGEAYFEVAKDRPQPFVVSANGGEIRAVGTAFNVRMGSEHSQVDLIEGIVELQDTEQQHRIRLSAGQSAQIGVDSIVTQQDRKIDALLWREGYLEFNGLPLKEAIDQINRYRSGKVILLNKRLAEKRVSGLFRLNALDQAISSLKTAVPGLTMRKLTPYLIILS